MIKGHSFRIRWGKWDACRNWPGTQYEIADITLFGGFCTEATRLIFEC
jgi:hypothetical protein